MRAKRAEIFGVFFAVIKGKRPKNNQKYVLYTRIFEPRNLENIKTPFQTFGEFWKILRPLEKILRFFP